MCNTGKMIFILGVFLFAFANGASIPRQETIFNALHKDCPVLVNITDFDKQNVIIDECKDNISSIVEVKEWNLKTIMDVMCLLYYNSVRSFCSTNKLIDRSQVIPDISALNINDMCKDFPEISNLTNGIFNQTNCPVVCGVFPQSREICGLSYKIYKGNHNNATEANNISIQAKAVVANNTAVVAGNLKVIAGPKPPVLEPPRQEQNKTLLLPHEPALPMQKPNEKSTESELVVQTVDLSKKNEPEIATVSSTTAAKTLIEHQPDIKIEPAKKPDTKPNEEKMPDIKLTTKMVAEKVPENVVPAINQDADRVFDQVKPPIEVENGENFESPDGEIPNPNQIPKLQNVDNLENSEKDDAYGDDDALAELNGGKGLPEKPKLMETSNISNDDDLDGESDFFSYFMVICLMVVLGYVAYHNRQKLFALMIEGKRGKRQYRGRRPNSANYHKLDSNLEEAITSDCSKSTSHIIY